MKPLGTHTATERTNRRQGRRVQDAAGLEGIAESRRVRERDELIRWHAVMDEGARVEGGSRDVWVSAQSVHGPAMSSGEPRSAVT
jgi:hypothetical protein